VAAVTKIKMRVFKQANVNLSLSHVEQSGDSRANGARLSDLIAKAIQSEIKDEIHADRKDLHQLREIEVSTSPQFADGCRQRLPYSKPGWIIRATPSSKNLITCSIHGRRLAKPRSGAFLRSCTRDSPNCSPAVESPL
jgi:hypothetical protein